MVSLRRIGAAVVCVTAVALSPTAPARSATVSAGSGTAPAGMVDASSYGALALSRSTGAFGAGRGDSESMADARALMYCGRGGAPDCSIKVRGQGEWLAIATSITGGPYGTGRGPTRQDAVGYALDFCRQYGGGDACGLRYALDLT
jgi:hypothetical protein